MEKGDGYDPQPPGNMGGPQFGGGPGHYPPPPPGVKH